LFFAALNYRSTRWAKPVLLGLLVILLADVGYWVRERFGRGDLRMTVLDVGQGSSALLELPGGVCILVDGGGFYDNRFDVGARVVAPFLWQKKIATVDILVLSHPHPDHLNGLVFIADHFNVQEIWMTGEAARTRPYQALMDIISDKGIQVNGPEALARPLTIHGVRIETLYPPIDFLKRKSREGWRTGNNNSMVLKVSLKDVSFLLPGDTEVEAERELADAACEHLKSNVLVVPHHGSRTSSTMMFLKCVQPDVGVVSSGWKNIFRFPHKQVLDRYRAIGCDLYRTDLQGAVTLTTDGTGLDVQTFLPQNQVGR
jgi:competence protein ComEC